MMGIYYEEDEDEADREYEAWIQSAMREADELVAANAMRELGTEPVDYDKLREYAMEYNLPSGCEGDKHVPIKPLKI